MAGNLIHRVRPGVDTLRTLARRYLGDPNRWVEIAVLNDLPGSAYADLAGVSTLKIPVEVGPAGGRDDPYLKDLAVKDRGIVLGDDLDVQLIGGIPNLVSSLLRGLETTIRRLIQHPTYGLNYKKHVASPPSGLARRFLRLDAERQLNRDPRVQSVKSLSTTQEGRTISIRASVQPVGTNDTIEILAERKV